MAPLMPLLDNRVEHRFVYTSQHYSFNMAKVFFEQMGMRKPDAELMVSSSSVGKLKMAVQAEIRKTRPEGVICYGDTNSTLAIALAAESAGVPLCHIEAGFRSFDRRMPEEVNRFEIDQKAQLLLCPTHIQEANLEREKAPGKKFVTGNLISDAVELYYPRAMKESRILKKLGLRAGKFCVLTAHRQENVDSRRLLSRILEGVRNIGEVVYPIHPRTKKNLEKFGLKIPQNVRLLDPIGYFDFLSLEANAGLTITDSGGVQEECILLHTPCLTIRNSTERWETLINGGNFVTGLDPFLINQYARTILDPHSGLAAKMRRAKSPYGKNVAEKMLRIILREL